MSLPSTKSPTRERPLGLRGCEWPSVTWLHYAKCVNSSWLHRGKGLPCNSRPLLKCWASSNNRPLLKCWASSNNRPLLKCWASSNSFCLLVQVANCRSHRPLLPKQDVRWRVFTVTKRDTSDVTLVCINPHSTQAI